ncbi:antirestriction protein [Novosphingobium chloroacetimidivorans]|uniref:Antirestriction protein n=1 Tax=Novosphingobium chloroacetimidivorans TaxID=1428314 RepID=A0A7W7NVD3_9SPHN|nr:hypothetical protein [Novosphingobium chloroacetimidivorans]MBB4857002.1 antirestriction protein [Novosphingobium chloroacetimidivorans]
MSVGRPSSYLPEYCEKVRELGREGCSVVEMAAEIGVSRATLEANWPAAHPEFLEALEEARDLSQAWWEKQGRMNLTADKFQASLYSRSMAARFPADWRESKQIEHKGGVTVTAGEHDTDL